MEEKDRTVPNRDRTVSIRVTDDLHRRAVGALRAKNLKFQGFLEAKLEELANELSNEQTKGQKTRESTVPESTIKHSFPGDPLFAMLGQILTSGHSRAIAAISANIEAFWELVVQSKGRELSADDLSRKLERARAKTEKFAAEYRRARKHPE